MPKFGYCTAPEGARPQHEKCPRKLQKWHWSPDFKKIIWEDEWSYCSCKAKGCPCRDNDTEAKAPVKRKRKQ
jgi:hypothetical protein